MMVLPRPDGPYIRDVRPLASWRVEREERLFGRGRGVPVVRSVGSIAGGGVFGVGIGTASEVRAVRVCFGDGSSAASWSTGDWIEVVEGAPVEVYAPAGAMCFVESLDLHDGALELVFAATPDSVRSLPLDVAPQSEIVWGRRSGDFGLIASTAGDYEATPAGDWIVPPPTWSGQGHVWDLAPPRFAPSGDRRIAVQLFVSSGSGSVVVYGLLRDRAGYVVDQETIASVAIAPGRVVVPLTALGAARESARVQLPGSVVFAGRAVLL